MTLDDATRQLAHILRAENAALANGDAETATRLLAGKAAAAATLRAAIPGAQPNPLLATELRNLARENADRLTFAIEVQGRILELVARAARAATPGPTQYGAHGRPRSPIGALALAFRA